MREAEFRAAIVTSSIAYPHRRFGVYRNNVDGALCNALRVRFPVVERILGGRDFSRLAKEYSSKVLPQSPVLIGYGDTFPEFIETTGCGPGFLGDIARLESGWWKAYHAEEAMPVGAERFQQFTLDDFARLFFTFHPSVALVDSQWAIGSIWEDIKQDKECEGQESRGPEMILVCRPEGEVHMHVVKGASRTLLPCLIAGENLAEAVEAALASYPSMDLETELRMLISSQIVCSFILGSAPCDQ